MVLGPRADDYMEDVEEFLQYIKDNAPRVYYSRAVGVQKLTDAWCKGMTARQVIELTSAALELG